MKPARRGRFWALALVVASAGVPASADDGKPRIPPPPPGTHEVSPPPPIVAPVVHRDRVPVTHPIRETLLGIIAHPDDAARVRTFAAALKQAGHPLPQLPVAYSIEPGPGLARALDDPAVRNIELTVDIYGLVRVFVPVP